MLFLQKSRFIDFRKIAPCLFALIVDYMGFGLIYPIVTEMFTQVNPTFFPKLVSIRQRDFFLGLAYLVYPFFMIFGASFWADLSDMWGRKKVFLLSLFGGAIGFACMAIAGAYHLLFLFLFGRALSGFMAGSQPLTQASVADLSSPENKSWNMAVLTFVGGISVSLGPFISGVFSEQVFINKYGFALPFVFSAIMAFIGFLWILFGFEETLPKKRKERIDFLRPFKLFKKAWLEPKIRFLAFIFFLFQIGFGFYYQFMANFLQMHFNYRSTQLGYFYGYIGIGFVVGVAFVLPYFLKRYKIAKITAVSLGIMALFVILSMLYINAIYIWVLAFIIGLTDTINYAGFLTLFSNATDEKNQGWAMGILSATMALSFVFSGLATNLLPFIKAHSLIIIAGILACIGAILLYKNSLKFDTDHTGKTMEA